MFFCELFHINITQYPCDRNALWKTYKRHLCCGFIFHVFSHAKQFQVSETESKRQYHFPAPDTANLRFGLFDRELNIPCSSLDTSKTTHNRCVNELLQACFCIIDNHLQHHPPACIFSMMVILKTSVGCTVIELTVNCG